MKVIDSITLRCIAHATEDIEKVKCAFMFVAGVGNIKFTKTRGYHGNDIVLLSITLHKNRDIAEFWKRMKEFGVISEILSRLNEIVDDAGYLHLRFDKQEAYKKRVAIRYSGDSIVLKMKIVSYPWKKEKAIKNLVDFFNSI